MAQHGAYRPDARSHDNDIGGAITDALWNNTIGFGIAGIESAQYIAAHADLIDDALFLTGRQARDTAVDVATNLDKVPERAGGMAGSAIYSAQHASLYDWTYAITTGVVAIAGSKGAGVLKGGAGAIKSRTYIDITRGGSIRNVGTNASYTEFAETLTSNGWASRTSGDGMAQIFESGGATYSLHARARSYSGWTADYTPAGASDVTLKIRLGYPQ